MVQIPPLSEQEQQAYSGLPQPESWSANDLAENSHHLRERLPLLELRTGWEPKATGKKDPQAKCGTRPSPISTDHTAKLVSQGCQMGRGGAGASPPAAARRSPYLLPGCLPSVAGPARCLRAGEGYVAYPTRSGSRSHAEASAGSGAAVLYRPVLRRSRVWQELKLLCKEQGGAQEQAETAGATPRSGCGLCRPALSQTGEFRPRARPSGPTPICPRACCLPEYPRKGRQECRPRGRPKHRQHRRRRQQQQQQQRDVSSPRRALALPSRGKGFAAAAAADPGGDRAPL